MKDSSSREAVTVLATCMLLRDSHWECDCQYWVVWGLRVTIVPLHTPLQSRLPEGNDRGAETPTGRCQAQASEPEGSGRRRACGGRC